MPQENQLPVIDQGSGITAIDVDAGTAGDAYAGGTTFQKATLQRKVWIIVQTYGAKLTLFSSAAGATLDEMTLLPNMVYELDCANYGGKIKNSTAGAGQNAVFEFWWMA